MMMKTRKPKVQLTSNYILISRLNNKQLVRAMKNGLRIACWWFKNVPVEISIFTWDEDYGDVLPDGYVVIKPCDSFKMYGRSRSSYEIPD